ncbi:thioredoxin-like protein [Pavlovales sp. CCMP2436]|nr:thioredoxin-like protein [Pavlovales sp. CCMP2436]
MPLICIGPVCVPISAVLPLILWALRPLWEALPAPLRERIEKAARPILDWLEARILSRMRGLFGGSAKPAKGGAAAGTTNGANAAKSDSAFALMLAAALDAKSAAVLAIDTPEQLAAAREVCVQRGCALVLDFTAPWCGPCQRIKPQFSALALTHPEHVFAAIDVDSAPELQTASGVLVLPTFQFFQDGVKIHQFSGGSEETIQKLRAAIAFFSKKGN